MSNSSEVHDPGAAASAERASKVADAVSPLDANATVIRFGTASWTDPTTTAPGVFYPADANTPESRLKFYATKFSVVEVDSSYYALPSRKNAELWVERTPPGFTFDIKAHALMTGQPSEVNRLPSELKAVLPKQVAEKPRVYAKDLPDDVRAEIWIRFRDAIEPLRAAGKLGAVMLQFPRWVTPSGAARREIAEAVERLDGIACTVEFRNARWFGAGDVERTLRMLEEVGASYVMVDGPQGMESSVPPIVAITNPALAVVRLHGRRAETWEKQGVPVVERFRYLYSEQELAEWVPRVREAAGKARLVHVLMNNCYANYGTTNALELAALVKKAYANS